MLGVAAFLGDVFGGLPGRADLHELGVVVVFVFAEVRAQAALAVVNLQHGKLLSNCSGGRTQHRPPLLMIIATLGPIAMEITSHVRCSRKSFLLGEASEKTRRSAGPAGSYGRAISDRPPHDSMLG